MSEFPRNISFTLEELEQIFKANYKLLVYTSSRILGTKETAEDIVQECFYKFWKDREKIYITSSLKAYLFRSVTNASLNHLKLSKKLSDLDSLQTEPSEEQNDLSDEGGGDLSAKVREAIESLPPKCKTIFILSRYEGLKYREIAETLNISVKTVENQMSIAFEKLRDKLKEYAATIVAILIYWLF